MIYVVKTTIGSNCDVISLHSTFRYGEKAKELSKLSRDRPLSPLDTAVWWTEYVLRTDQSALSFLKPLSINQPWWKTRLLDVWTIIFISILATLSLFFAILVFLIKYFLKKFYTTNQPQILVENSNGSLKEKSS